MYNRKVIITLLLKSKFQYIMYCLIEICIIADIMAKYLNRLKISNILIN